MPRWGCNAGRQREPELEVLFAAQGPSPRLLAGTESAFGANVVRNGACMVRADDDRHRGLRLLLVPGLCCRGGRGRSGAPAAPRRQARARTNELDAGQSAADDRKRGRALPGRRSRAPLGCLGSFPQRSAHPGRAPFGDVPVADGAVAAAYGGVRPAQAASLRAEPNRVMSPISASSTSAVYWPTPGSWVSTRT